MLSRLFVWCLAASGVLVYFSKAMDGSDENNQSPGGDSEETVSSSSQGGEAALPMPSDAATDAFVASLWTLPGNPNYAAYDPPHAAGAAPTPCPSPSVAVTDDVDSGVGLAVGKSKSRRGDYLVGDPGKGKRVKVVHVPDLHDPKFPIDPLLRVPTAQDFLCHHIRAVLTLPDKPSPDELNKLMDDFKTGMAEKVDNDLKAVADDTLETQ